MTHKILIDYNRRGWADEKESKIKNDYQEILHVGVPPNPSADSSDLELASFCEENNCDLLTGDKRAYASLLQNEHVKAVQISKYDMDELSNDYKKSDRRKKSRAIKDRENLNKIFGSGSHTKIWSDKKSNTSLF